MESPENTVHNTEEDQKSFEDRLESIGFMIKEKNTRLKEFAKKNDD